MIPGTPHRQSSCVFRFDFPADRQPTPPPVNVQCSNQVFECGAFPTAAAKSQSQKLALLPPVLRQFSLSNLAQHEPVINLGELVWVQDRHVVIDIRAVKLDNKNFASQIEEESVGIPYAASTRAIVVESILSSSKRFGWRFNTCGCVFNETLQIKRLIAEGNADCGIGTWTLKLEQITRWRIFDALVAGRNADAEAVFSVYVCLPPYPRSFQITAARFRCRDLP